MYKLQISPEALKDLTEIKEYISVDLESPNAASNTVAKITRVMRNLVNFPHSGTPLSSVINSKTDYRFRVCNNYLIFYVCDNTIIYVSRVLYSKRDYMKILFGSIQEE